MEGQGSIAPADQSRITHHVNETLTALYSRFSHKTDYVNVRLSADRNRYSIKTQNAVSNTVGTNLAPRYLIDSEDVPFANDLIKIIRISTEEGEGTDRKLVDCPLNDKAQPKSLRTISYNELFVPDPVERKILTIEYQAKHKRLSIPVDLDEEIILAPVLETALEAAVASRVYGSMNGEENTNKSIMLNNEYETMLALVDVKDLMQETMSADHNKFIKNGWA